MQKTSKIYVAGHRGLVGSALLNALNNEGYTNCVVRSREEMDLTNQAQVNAFFASEQPEYVFLAAAKVGGILANNTYRGDFIYQNLAIQTNVIEAARHFGVKRLLFLGSSCIYPRHCPQPMREEYLMQGTLEQTNEPYAIAKIAGITMCESYNQQFGTDFVSVMPTNLYGPGDNYDLHTSHVPAALIRKIHDAKINNLDQVVVWGSGHALREFLYVDDLASACLFIMKMNGYKDRLNIGSGDEVTIKQFAEMICEIIGYQGKIVFDTSKPDGTPRKLVDTTRLNKLGWQARVSLKEGLQKTYDCYVREK